MHRENKEGVYLRNCLVWKAALFPIHISLFPLRVTLCLLSESLCNHYDKTTS